VFDIDSSIREWKDHLRARGGVSEADLEELEGHLRDEIAALCGAGLTPDEAFLVAVKRLGTADALSGEFAKVNAGDLWKQLLLVPEDPAGKRRGRREVGIVVALALMAGLLAKIPELFGIRLAGGTELWYARNLVFFVLPSVVAYLAWKRSLAPAYPALLGAALLLTLSLTLLYPFAAPRHTELLTALHLPIVLWLLVCVVYGGPRWRSAEGRMDFLRFTGETFIYSVLVGCGGAVLVAFTVAIFSSIGINVTRFASEYLVLMGGCAIPVVAVFLVEAKRSIVENLAPVLARIFSPLFLVVLLAFVVVMPITGKTLSAEREFLIAFDLMLALVLGLVLYVISAHRDTDKANAFDYLNLALIAVALVADGIALASIVARLSSFGLSPNKVAALGENVALLVNLVGLAVLYLGYLRGKLGFRSLVWWQTAYLPVYAVWAALVALGFPPIFGYR
jgi:hypothetical protein